MSKRKSLTLRGKMLIEVRGVWYGTKVEDAVDRILRLIRDEQRRKCKKCLEQTVENIKAREMERMGMDSSNSDFYKGIK
ncbi:MAG: hypothetical protein PHR28_11250 [candidate division Zixibacteria bacterium]|nr:hypothetical protein [candidate division Zixibacteria bacterium]